MAGIANASGVSASSEIIEATDVWNLPLSAEEQKLIDQYPSLTNAVSSMSGILEQLNQPISSLDSQILITRLREFKKFWGEHLIEGDDEIKTFCGDFMARRGAAASIRTYIAQCYRLAQRQSIMDDFSDPSIPWWVKDVCTRLRSVVSWWTDCSYAMCDKVGESKLLPDLLFEVQHMTRKVRKMGGNVSLYETNDMQITIVILYNCSRCPDSIRYFIQTNALSALRPVRHTNLRELKWIVLSAMCNIARDEGTKESDWIADSMSLRWAIKMLKKGQRTSDIPVDVGNTRHVTFKGSELLEGLESVTSRPENRRMAETCGLLPVLLQLLTGEQIEEKTKILACRTLRNLCLTEGVREDVREADAEKVLQQLCASEVSQDLREAAQEALQVTMGAGSEP